MRLRGSRLMPVNQLSVYIVYSVFVCMQLRERIILNSEMADVRAIFNSAVETSLLELLGVSRVLRNEKVKAISTLASGQELLAVLKRYPHFYLRPKCCLFQYVFFLWRVDYTLEGSMF